ncbi:MAG: PIN domain-containing protein [Dehalococcoidia bacterium]|nr:PIN domain-containing protein [Dehalococcoidia bacterium]
MDRLYVDSGAFIAYFDGTDQYHFAATAFFEEVKRKRSPLLTMNYVLNETYTWLQRKPGLGYLSALRFGNWFKGLSSPAELREGRSARAGQQGPRLEVIDSRNLFAVVFSSPEIEDEAWRLFNRYCPLGATYTDCVSFAVMALLGLERAFTFDEHFAAAGFVRVPKG